MTKVNTHINCPNCRQMIAAEIEQIFDVRIDPTSKQRLISGQANIANCPHCGFHGNLSTPLLYHDPEIELLLTYMPPELNLPKDEQEKAIGKLLNEVLNSLPQEERKGYLLNPQQTFTLQGMVERVLQEDGVTKEMIEEQQVRLKLIQRMVTITDPESLEVVAKEEDKNINSEFYTLINQLVEASLANGDQNSAQQLTNLQQALLPITTFGKELQTQSKELQKVVEALENIKEELTREKLLDLVIQAPNETQISAYVSMARGGMDYEFFQQLTEKIEAAKDDEKERLTALRENLLELTARIDKEVEARLEVAEKNLNALLEVDNIAEATRQNLRSIDEFFVQALNANFAHAKENGDSDRETKIQQIVDVLEEASNQAAGPDPKFIQELIDADAETRKQLMTDRSDEITSELVEALTGLLVQLDASPDNQEMTDKVRSLYREAVRMSMQASMKAG